MPERNPPPLDAATLARARGPRRLRFEGILEGRRTPADGALLRERAAEVGARLPARASLELEGGRFSLLISGDSQGALPGADFERASFAEALQRLVDSSSEPLSVESTLRCTEHFEEEVIETLFAVSGGRVRALSRARRREPEERERPAAPRPPAWSRALLAALATCVLGLFAWQAGWIERLLAPRADSLALQSGPFEGLLELRVAREAGNYRLRLARGRYFPESTRQLDALLEGAATPLERAAIAAATGGGRIVAELRDAQGELLAAAELDLASLLAERERPAEALLPGRRRASAIRLTLGGGGPGR